jgi:hypothetical protein
MSPAAKQAAPAKQTATGKRIYKSGAQKAKERKARLAAEASARAKLAGDEHPTDKYRRLGPPPDDAIGTIAYANRAAGLLLHDVLTDRAIESETDRRRMAKDFIAVVGMTGVKALYEQRLKKLEARVYGKGQSDEDGDGLEDEKP